MIKALAGALLALVTLTPVKAATCTDIRGKVCTLQSGYNPVPPVQGSGAYVAPTCDGAHPPSQTNIEAIQTAFALIQGFKSQDEFCSLDQIFIMNGGTIHSWGKWENPTYYGTTPPGKSYIALTESDLGKKAVDVLVSHSGGLGHGTDTQHSSKGDKVELGLLYILAHELGHIKWHKAWDPTGNQTATPITCFDEKFLDGSSWDKDLDSDKDDIARAKTQRWTPFGIQLGSHSSSPWPRHAKGADVAAILNNGFVTALAAANPEEDFVETYSVRTLMKAVKQNSAAFPSFELNARNSAGPKIKIDSDRNQEALVNKFQCVDSLVGGPDMFYSAGKKRQHRRY